MTNTEAYEEQIRQQREEENERRRKYENERADYAYDQWRMGKDPDKDYDDFDRRQYEQ